MARLDSPAFQILLILCLSLLPSRSGSAVIQLLLHKVRKTKLTAETTPSVLPEGPISAQQLLTTGSPSTDDYKSSTRPVQGGLALPGNDPRHPKAVRRMEKNGWLNIPLQPSDGSLDQSEQNANAGSTRDIDEGLSPALQAKQSLIPPREFPLKGSGETLLLLRLPSHNIKKSWCRMHPFKQEIRHHGCNSTVIDNHMCYGQCNSFYIPGNFVSCSRCTPSAWKIITVELKCPSRSQASVVKKVKITESCHCRPCDI